MIARRKSYMLKKHKKELMMCCIIPILIVVLVLALVSIFEVYGIHVPGSREMWIGFIGSIIGGAFTLIGVLTIKPAHTRYFSDELAG